MSDFSLILAGRIVGKDIPVARALSDAFGQTVVWGEQVVSRSPITVLSGLRLEQARGIKATLAPIEKVGCRFDVREGVDRSFSQLTWNIEPTLFGKPLSSYGAAGGEEEEVSIYSFEIPASSVPLQIEIRVQPVLQGGAEGSRRIASKPARRGSGTAPAAALPPLTPAQQQRPAGQVNNPRQPVGREVTPIADYPAPSSPGAPAPKAPGTSPKVIPDVPLVPGMPGYEQLKPPSPAKGNPMRLEDFEAGIKEAMSNPSKSRPGKQPELEKINDSDELEELPSSGASEKFRVVISNCASPKAVQLIAEIMNIPVEQARNLSRRPRLTAAQNLSKAKADALAGRFRAVGAQALVIK